MEDDDNNKKDRDGLPLPDATFSDLLGKQSVRATFRLSERAIEAISIVAGHLGIKKKSLFDHLIEDSRALHIIAKNLPAMKSRDYPRVQKTFVLSRRTLDSLEQISRMFDTPRDALVEYSIQRLDAVIRTEREKHERRKTLIGELEIHVRKTRELAIRAKEILGEEDAVCHSLDRYLAAGIQSYREIEDILEKGRIIEEF